MELFNPVWFIYIPAFLIVVFAILSIIFSLIKLKFEETKASIFATSFSGLVLSIVNICVVCLAPAFAIFGIFLDFPIPIVSFLFGATAISLSNIIIEKTKKDFIFKEFVVTTGMITIMLIILFFVYQIPDAIGTIEADSGYHIHADFKMFVNNKEVEIYKPENFERDKCVHFHKGSKDVIHIECEDVTIDYFLKSLDAYELYLYPNPFFIFVNKVTGNTADINYTIRDLDKILITNSNDFAEMKTQFDSIEGNAKLE